MSNITVLIVDDEPLARESLRTALQEFEDVDVLQECANGFEAVQAVQKLKPDLLFLDIQMPKLDGFDVVELLGKEAPLIVFVTSYDEYALRAFEAEALDYILKPVKSQRLQKSIQRVRQQVKIDFEPLIEKHRDSMAPLNRILIRSGYDVIIIPTKDIVYLEAQDDYVKIHTREGKSFLKSQRMSTLEKTLDSTSFCRIHRSYIMNIEFLKKIEPYSKDSRLAKLQNGARLPISRAGYTRLSQLL